MFSFLGFTVGWAAIIMYIYVALAIARAEWTAENTMANIFFKAVAWPVTIWHTIQKLYDTDPLT